MSLEKAIRYGKEKRKNYYGSEAFDHSCRPHGGCPYCENNRKFADKKARRRANKTEQENEFFGYWNMPDPTDVMMDIEEEIHKKVGTLTYAYDIGEPEDWSMD
jgi:hypothetical protein